jgi:ketosteroid isomerase-like protein
VGRKWIGTAPGGAAVTTEMTRAALDDLIRAFDLGDHERLAARYDDDIDWIIYAPVTIFPYAGARHGKNEVLACFAMIYQTYSVIKTTVTQKIVDGDRAATITETQLVQRETGRTIRSRMANFMRFRDGKMIEYRGFTDSFDTAEQVLGHEIEID